MDELSCQWLYCSSLIRVDIFVRRSHSGYSGEMDLKGITVLMCVVFFAATSMPFLTFAQNATTTAATSTPPTLPNAGVENRVEAYFVDVPVMSSIAKCESNFRQFDAAGALSGGAQGGMVGVFQINTAIHKSAALALGMDITTLEGNLAYARHLYEQEGTAPWNSSSDCWKNAAAANENANATSTENYSSQQLTEIAQLRAQIAALQKILAGLLQSRNAVAHLN